MRIYRDIIKTAWQVLWRNPWMWPLGLLAAVAGTTGEFGSLISAINRLSNQASLLEDLRSSLVSSDFARLWANLSGSLGQHPGLVMWTLLWAVVTALAVVWIVIVAQAALITGAGAANTGKSTTFTRAVAHGATKFWPIFCVNLLARFATYLVMAMAFLPYLINYLMGPTTSGSFDTLILISFILLVPVALVISFVLKYAAIAIVLEGRSWWTSLSEGVNLFFRNWLVSLEMAVALFAINFVVSMVVFMFIPTGLALDLLSLSAGFSLLNFLRVLPTAILLLVVDAWLATYQYTAWTILFQRLRQGSLIPKLLRATEEVPNYLERWFWPVAAPARPAPRRRR